VNCSREVTQEGVGKIDRHEGMRNVGKEKGVSSVIAQVLPQCDLKGRKKETE